jgi:hypothetical protein
VKIHLDATVNVERTNAGRLVVHASLFHLADLEGQSWCQERIATMGRGGGGDRLDEQAKRRVEAIVQRELKGETEQLERLRDSLQQELAKDGEPGLARASQRVFIGIIYDNEPWGVWI